MLTSKNPGEHTTPSGPPADLQDDDDDQSATCLGRDAVWMLRRPDDERVLSGCHGCNTWFCFFGDCLFRALLKGLLGTIFYKSKFHHNLTPETMHAKLTCCMDPRKKCSSRCYESP